MFLDIADKGSLSAVARAWAVAPSTVTLSLRRLEEQMETRLVMRTTRRLSLTPEGARLATDLRRILVELDDIIAPASAEHALAGSIRVTCPNDFGRAQLAPLTDAFSRRHPGIDIQLHLSDTVVDLIRDGFDLAFRTGPLRDSSLLARLLIRGTRRVCASPAYWDRAGRPRHPRDLVNHNCLVLNRPGDPQTVWRFQEAGQEFGVKVGGNRSCSDGDVLRRWASAGAGVVLKVDWDLSGDLETGRLECVLDDYALPEINLYAIQTPGTNVSRRISLYVDYVSQHLRDSISAR